MSKTPDTTPQADQPGQGAPEATEAQPKAPKPKTTPKVSAITVRSVPESFCRAGRRWTREAQTVPTSDFTKDQLAALRAENNLVVVDCEMEA